MKSPHTNQRRNLWPATMVLAAAAVGWSSLSNAIDYQPGPPGVDTNFELDGNPQDDPGTDGDDWVTVFNGTYTGNVVATTGLIDDPSPLSIFTTGGSKDILDIPRWRWKEGTVPDKDQILHGYAVAYGVDGELIAYLGADRYANDGDAMMGAWFFQDVVGMNPDGTFSGQHRNGDILWLGEFTGGGVVATLSVLVWNDPALPGYKPSLEQVKNTNLAYVVKDSTTGSGPGFYATVNMGDVVAPWDYTPKQGTPGVFPYNSFMEGGINITMLLGGNTPCFSSYLIESRSSSSPTATLKDFVLGSFNTCRISIDKECLGGTLSADLESIDWSYRSTVTNSGYGTITELVLRDDAGTASIPGDDWSTSWAGILAPGDQQAFEYTIHSTQNGPTNVVYATGKVGDYQTAEVTDTVTCPAIPINPAIDVTKNCDRVEMESTGSSVVARVYVSGNVCNDETNTTKLKQVSAVDDVVGPLTLSKTTLMPGECATFSANYYPSTIAGSGAPGDQQWADTVTATGTEPITGEQVSDFDSATCPLCPTCPTCPTP